MARSGTMPVFASVSILTSLALLPAGWAVDSNKFDVRVHRELTKDGLVIGKISVNGQEIGTCYENAEKKVPAGTYKGVLRHKSTKNFVQGPGGRLGKTGDFLLEVAGVPKRTDILFHAGNKREHSEGCIMLGAASHDPKSGDPVAPEALKKLRLLFYDGNDSPASTPDKAITIEIRDP
jgi:hypothetical protein